MKKPLILTGIVALLLGAAAARAEWTKIGDTHSATAVFTLYADATKIQRNGDLVKMWDLQDFRQPQKLEGATYLSEKSQLEFDCKGKKARILSTIDLSGSMGIGNVVYSDGDASEWTAIAAETLGDMEIKLACGKK